MAKRLLAFAAAVGLLAWMHTLFAYHSVHHDWTVAFAGDADRLLQQVELLHYAALLLLGLPAACLFASSISDRDFRDLARLLERAGLWLPAVWTTLATFCVSRWITQGAWFTDDEQAYLFEMNALLHGQLSVPVLPLEPLFHHPFVVLSQFKDATLWWAGTYPPMQPAMMALSSLLGSPLISQWLCAGAISYHSGKLAESMTGERRLGVCAAWLCGFSPMLIGLSSTYHTSVLACLLSLLCLRASLSAGTNPSLARGLLAGACAGATFLTRGLEGTLMVAVTGAVLVWMLRRRWRALLFTLLGCALSGGVALALYFYVNYVTTGDAFDTTYAIWAREHGSIMGFGDHMMWGRTHTPSHGFSQTFTTLVRMNAWVFGWPCSLGIALLGLLPPLRSRGVVWLLSLCAAQLFGYFFLAWGAVHDFGAAYHVWHVPYLAAASAVVAQQMRDFHLAAPRLMLGLILVGLLAFWPSQLFKWHTSAAATLAPVRAAETSARGRRCIVLWTTLHVPGVGTWVHYPPTPYPDNQLLWARDLPGAEGVLRSAFPDRVFIRVYWSGLSWRAVQLPK